MDHFRSIRNTVWATVPLLAWAVYHWTETVRRILRYYTPLPVWDYWDIVAHLQRYRAFDLSVLWVQHNEHRIVFPEIVFALDMLLFRGRQIFPICVSALCYMGILAVLGWMLRADQRLSAWLQLAVILLDAIILGWQGSAVFLADTFLLQWTMLQFAVAASLALLTFSKLPASGWYFAASLAFAEVATFSSGNGMLLWPVLALAALALGLGRRRIWVLGGTAAASIFLYFIGYRFSGSLNLKNFVTYPLYSLEFLGAYLSMPFGGMKAPLFGVSVGLAGMGVAFTLFCIAARKRLLGAPAGVVFFGIYFFDVLTALLVAAGRMDPSDPHFQSAEAARYLSLPLVNWAVLVTLLIWMSGACGWKLFSPARACAAIALLSLLGFPKLRWWLQDRDFAFSDRQLATLALRNGILDQNLIEKVFPDPYVALPLIRQLRDDHLSVFADRTRGAIGAPLQSFFPRWKQPGFGAVTYMHPVASGVEVMGWADTSRDHENTSDIVLVNEFGVIVGYGKKLEGLFPDRLTGLHTPPSLGWAGFVNLTVKSNAIQPYLVRKHQLVALGGLVSVPAITVEEPGEAGRAIRGVNWEAHSDEKRSSWKLNGELPTNQWLGTSPQGAVYSSRAHWGGDHWEGDISEINGLLTATFPTPSNGCVVLPLLHGPLADGILVTVDELPVSLQNGETAWTYFRIPAHGPSTTLKISAPDRTRWLAVGEPRECR